jgi:6-phospho 3-hexuloisomerase
MKNVSTNLIGMISDVIGSVSSDCLDEIIVRIKAVDRIFIVGAGRSGLVGKFFGMRLMHLGKVVYIAGETTTPKIRKNDLLVAISASGKTASVVNAATIAKKNEAVVASITANNSSPLNNNSDCVVKINQGSYPEDMSIAPMGTLFEMSVLVTLESLIGSIILDNEVREEEMRARHANLE